mmetsp:Transcript_37548/g.50975  ORF Transcript_37548/g.50975 Transcript_37548/m.50975 type:complete len:106 (-) Transcript_37548:78-395(-)
MTSLVGGPVMKTVPDEVTNKVALEERYETLIKSEPEVLFLGQDAYLPRLVTSMAPIMKPQEMFPALGAENYAQPTISNRPKFEGSSQPALKEPHVFPKSTVMIGI